MLGKYLELRSKKQSQEALEGLSKLVHEATDKAKRNV
jgi:cation transport ATPase